MKRMLEKIGVKMKNVYIVKSFGPENGYVNLKAFTQLSDAENYQSVIQKERNLEYGGRCVEVVPHIPMDTSLLG